MGIYSLAYMLVVVLRLICSTQAVLFCTLITGGATDTPHPVHQFSTAASRDSLQQHRRDSSCSPVVRSAWRCSVACVASSAANTSLPRAYSCSRWKVSSKARASKSLTLSVAKGGRKKSHLLSGCDSRDARLPYLALLRRIVLIPISHPAH